MTLTITHLKDLFSYDSLTGDLIRIKAFGTRRKLFEGKIAGYTNRRGYRQISIDGIRYQAHRLVWFYHNGTLPSVDIDHINGNRSDNRIENLREAFGSINQINTKLHRHNTSGIRGVSWNKSNNKWTVSIYQNNKRINLGYFDSIEAARERRLQAEESIYKGIKTRTD